MSRRVLRLVALLAAFAVLVAGECEIDINLIQRQGTITVTNTGAEPAVLAIIADDVRSYPTLAAGATATVATRAGGAYQVRVVMTPESARSYGEGLRAMRSLVEKQIAGAASAAEKVQLFSDLAGIKGAIQALEQVDAAGCSGRIQLNVEQEVQVQAQVAWQAQAGSGFWELSCGSSQ